MITVLLIVHGLLAVALLGAITHQALSVVSGAGRGRAADFRRDDSAASTAAAMRTPSWCSSS